MVKKIAAIVAAVALAGTLGLLAVGGTLADEPSPPARGQPPRPGVFGRVWRGAKVVSDAVTDLLGLTRAEILAERRDGKTLSEIAQEQGVTDQEVIDTMLAKEQELLDRAVQNGTLTQEQADWLAAREKALAPFRLSNPFPPQPRPLQRLGRALGNRGHRGQQAPVPGTTSGS